MTTCISSDRAACALALLLCAGCFDVQQVELPSQSSVLQIDDFDDGDDVPSASSFAPWSCTTSPGTPRASCAASEPDLEGGRAEIVRFQLEDPANGTMDYPMLVFGTSTRLGLDLNGYAVLAFGGMLELEPLGPAQTPSLLLRLRCDEVEASRAGPEGSWIETAVEPGAHWSTFLVPLADLVRPNYLVNFSRRGCLEQVAALEFVIAPEPNDGQVMMGTLSLDDVALR